MSPAAPAKRPGGRPRKTPPPVHAGIAEAVDLARSIAAPARPEGIRGTLRRKAKGGDNEEAEVTWPRGWPMPEAGSIVLGPPEFGGGFTQYVEFDLVRQRIIVVVR